MATVITRYSKIIALQQPFDLGLDSNTKQRTGFNILAMKDASATFARELVQILRDAGVDELQIGQKVYTIKLLVGSTSGLPTANDDGSVHITETGGTGPELLHNQTMPAYHRPSAQIVARHRDYDISRQIANRAYDALVAVKNATVTIQL